jgi:hypothetical protein
MPALFTRTSSRSNSPAALRTAAASVMSHVIAPPAAAPMTVLREPEGDRAAEALSGACHDRRGARPEVLTDAGRCPATSGAEAAGVGWGGPLRCRNLLVC